MSVKDEIVQLQSELSSSVERSDDSVVRHRCFRAELVLRVAVMLLEQDPESPTVQNPAHYVRSKLNSAIGQFGIEVVPKPGC